MAIKVLKPEHVNSELQKEFAQEVYIMRFVLLNFVLYASEVYLPETGFQRLISKII